MSIPFAKLRAFAELARVANVFTAISNVWMGLIIATGGLPGWTAVGITATSALLYLAGMVLNDVFDHKQDAVERPERPLPSGRISLGAARNLGWGLLAAGVCAGWSTAVSTPSLYPGILATLLAFAIVLYNLTSDRLELRPILMAVCRTLNVALGMSVVPALIINGGYYGIVAGVGLYIASITLFASKEEQTSSRTLLVYGTLGVVVGLVVIAFTPWFAIGSPTSLRVQPFGWIALWIVVAGLILRRMVVAILQPTPKYVQRAVGHAILSLIVIDAAICLGFAEPYWACAVLSLLAPAMLLSQLFKVT